MASGSRKRPRRQRTGRQTADRRRARGKAGLPAGPEEAPPAAADAQAPPGPEETTPAGAAAQAQPGRIEEPPIYDTIELDEEGLEAAGEIVAAEELEAAEGLEAGGEAEAEYAGPEVAGEEESLKYRRGLFRSRKVLSMPFSRAAARRKIDPEFWEQAEEALIASDAGVAAATEIVELARKRIYRLAIHDIGGLKQAFRDEVVEMLDSFGAPPESPASRPRVLFVVGVNGVGKTTTSAKIGYRLKERGEKVLFAAADTFRAAGIEQMEMWANRVGAPVVRHKTGGDPAAVVFDSIESAQARGIDTVIVDTAGRLHTKKNLMDELNKMWRVAERQLGAPPEALLVIDATTGQNGVTQARIFGEALDLGSIALTKMDGSARGGVVLAIGRELGIPVSYIGVGEGMADLRPFDPERYAAALF